MSAYNSEKDLADMYVTSKASLSTSAEIATESQEKKDTEFARQFLEEEVVARRLAQVKMMEAEYERCLKERMVIGDEAFAHRLEYERCLEEEAEEAVARRLTQVKMEAEFERRLKERMDAEFEAKVEAKARELFSRVEEERQLTELQEKLRNGYGHFIEKQFYSSTLEYLKITSQIPLLSFHIYLNYDLSEPNDTSRSVKIVITNKNVLGLFPQKRMDGSDDYVIICLLYSFTSPLNLKQLHMFLNVIQYNPGNIKHGYNLIIARSPKRIESIIRSIPGKYSNGHWKQLDGFFGVYLNEDTLEVCAVPPSIDM